MEDHFDAILTKLGTGKWTIVYLLCIMYWVSVLPYHTIAGVFMAPPINHTCIPPPDAITRILLPPDIQNTPDNTTYTTSPNQESDSCTYLAADTTTGHPEEHPCTQWQFDNSTFTSTLTSEFQLVCDRRYYQATYQSIYMFGILVGAIFNGFLADKYGRWTLLAIASVAYTVIALGSAWLPTLSLILGARFLLGAMHPISLQTGYILVMEVSEVKIRTATGIVQTTTWGTSVMLFSALAYLIRDWRWLQTVASLPCLLFLPLIWVLGESPRWLAVVGQHERALKELKRAARWNKVTLPPDDQLLAIMQKVQQQAVATKRKNNEGRSQSTRLKQAIDQSLILFKTPKLRLITLVMCMDFFIGGMLFFGLTAGAPTLRVDPFVFLAISGLVELPTTTVIIPCVYYFGRRKMLLYNYLLCAIVLLAEPLIPDDLKWLSVTLVMLGKMAAAAAFAVLFLYAMELFPTEIRTQGASAGMASSRVGAIVAPFIMSSLNVNYPWAVSVVFGGASLLAGLVTWPLRESTGAKLPDTITELEDGDTEYIHVKQGSVSKNYATYVPDEEIPS